MGPASGDGPPPATGMEGGDGQGDKYVVDDARPDDLLAELPRDLLRRRADMRSRD